MRLLVGAIVLLVWLQQAWADEAMDREAKDRIVAQLSERIPDLRTDSVHESPVPGIYEVVTGTRVIYVSADANFAILGDMVDLKQQTNISENRRAVIVGEYLERVGQGDMLVIGSGDAKRHVTVFTDVDCPYCSQFHLDVPKLNEAGIEVRYLMFPRTGIGSRSYDRAVSVWCADDPIKAIGIAKAGGEVDPRTCTNPVAAHYNLGQEIGIRGTPTIILDSGRSLPGYVPPATIIANLGLAE